MRPRIVRTQRYSVWEFSSPSTLVGYGLVVLACTDAHEKAKLTREAYERDLCVPLPLYNSLEWIETLPLRPPKLEKVTIVQMSKTKTGSRKAMLHSLAHAECRAIDLMWDLIVRFVRCELPRAFYDDWLRIAAEEALHFSRWSDRLLELGIAYGEYACHEGLWDDAEKTSDDLCARLAVVHMVHEARGLDVFPLMKKKLLNGGDEKSAAILTENAEQEVGHVGAAVRWFRFLCEGYGHEPIEKFHNIVQERFRGALLPPFNQEMRTMAGMSPEWYEPLANAP